MIEKEVNELLNEIAKMCGNSLLEKMLDYCETKEVDPKWLGDLLSEEKTFKEMLYIDMVKHNQMRDPLFKKKLLGHFELDEW